MKGIGMDGIDALFENNLREHVEVCAGLAALGDPVRKAAAVMIETLRGGGRIFFCGNGGSAADAQHLSAELTGRFRYDRDPLDAHALHANTSDLTAVGNDYGFENVFARGVRAGGRKGDVLVGISTSGGSRNVVSAMRAAREMGLRSIALTGEKRGEMADLADVLIAVPSGNTARIQEMHILVGHTLCEIVERAMFPRS